MKRSFLFLCFVFSGAVFGQGTSVIGGGHEIGLEFTNAYFAAIDEIQKNQPELWATIQAEGLTTLPADLNIYIENKPIKVQAGNGEQDSVAANDMEKNIWIYDTGWRNILHPRIRQAIALHEVASLKKLERTGYYPISGKFLAKFNLRNDMIIFLTGQDPALPQWKSQRLNCDRRYTLKNEETGTILKRTDFSLYAQAKWNILDQIYTLQFVFATETSGNWPSPLNVPSLVQTVQTTIHNNDQENLTKYSGQALQIQNKEFVVINAPERFLLTEKLGNGRSYAWSYKNGKKVVKQQEKIETTLSDGSIRRVVNDLNPIYFKPVRQIEGTDECVEKIVPGDEWLALAGDKEIGAAVEKINARALMVYEANREFKACSSNCAGLEQALKAQRERFMQTWNGIFEEQKAKLKLRYKEERKKPIPAEVKREVKRVSGEDIE